MILIALVNLSCYWFQGCQSLAPLPAGFAKKVRLSPSLDGGGGDDADADSFISEGGSRQPQTPSGKLFASTRRELFLGLVGATVFTTSWTAAPIAAKARYVLDDETGQYVEVEETDWQTAWKQRLDKASTMSQDEIFQAARGAGNLELRTGPESDASKKRRAMSACRDAGVRTKASAGTEKECTARVFSGEVDFLLEAL